nr:MAG TPA: hypothetical protein [Caudoviricetes sp.]
MATRRKLGNGSVHLRKDGRWEGRCVIGYAENGPPRRRTAWLKLKANVSRN